jgi:hypothetical protein
VRSPTTREEELGVLVAVVVVLGPQVLRLFISSPFLQTITEPPGLYAYWACWVALLGVVWVSRSVVHRRRRVRTIERRDEPK